MADDPHAYIAELRAQGMPDEAIAHRLMLAGWKSNTIQSGLQRAPQSVSSARSAWRSGLMLFVGVFAGTLLAVGGGIYAMTNRPNVYDISLPAGDVAAPLTYGSWPALEDPQFYDDVKQRFIEQAASFITADLSAMKLTVYMGGEPVLEVPILAKGKVGSWWETPVGLYEINTREENHFSSFGKVYQPYSLAFQGNFFIHGWPYYPDGTEVASAYSGGCIRLSTEDARAVYELSKVGMPVFVYKTPEPKDAFQYHYKAPTVSSTAYVVADIETGVVLAGDNTSIQLPVASITKLMTALVVVEYLNIEKVLSVPSTALVSTVRPRLRAGQEATVRDLLALMLVESSNEAAETLASAVGRERFVDLMNKKAVAIGLKRTSFLDSSGLEVGNSSTAEDLFTLLRYLRENRRFILDMTQGSFNEATYGAVAFKQLQNYNEVKGITNAFYGGKVGETNAAKETYAGIFGLSLEGTERKIAVIVLGSADEQKDVAAMLEHLNTFYVSGVDEN